MHCNLIFLSFFLRFAVLALHEHEQDLHELVQNSASGDLLSDVFNEAVAYGSVIDEFTSASSWDNLSEFAIRLVCQSLRFAFISVSY